LWNSVWPGNVRQLENAVLRGLHLAREGVIEPDDLGLSAPGPGPALSGSSVPSGPAAPLPPEAMFSGENGTAMGFQEAKQRVIEAFEREYLTRAIAEHGGNVSRAARAARKERREFRKLLKKYRIDPRAYLSPR
jgi:two-component system, NtrC family, response regulator GlrR